MCGNLPPGSAVYHTGTALPVWLSSNNMMMWLCVYLCVRQAGIYWITLIDTFSSNWVLLVLALAEVIGFIYIYGTYSKFVFNWSGFQSVCWLPSLVSFTVLIDSNEMQNGESFVLSPGISSTFPCFPRCTAGGKRFIEDVEMMIGSRNYIFWLWWKACWYFFSPVILVVSAKIPPLVSWL